MKISRKPDEKIQASFKFVKNNGFLSEEQYIRRATNNASLLFHGASWQWSGHVVRAIAHAHTARSSRLLYGILSRSHFVSRNNIFLCAYFSMHFRIKFLLFNYFSLYFLPHVAKFFLEWENFAGKEICRKNENTHFMFSNSFFFENLSDYEIRYKNIEYTGKPQTTLRHMRIAWSISDATNTHPEYVILIALPLQQWLQERA